MEKFKNRWEITKNWQLTFPILGVVLLVLTAYYFSRRLLHFFNLNNTSFEWVFTLSVSIVFFYIFLRISLWCFEKLKNKWIVEYRWQMIAIFIVFAITGSTSLRVGRPIMRHLGITQENLQPIIYWVLYIVVGLIFYQVFLVIFGWLFGQHKFFWNFEKKMLKRMGLGFLFRKL
ncbi:DUF6787 family protein [Croceitalea rosinachiae]|uniref:Prolipoprotein diacylglyceryl transferase n=1 Tax=Croceitalea rosinachiae TaxID=3075596 RepID=A0ABU3ABV6_9FLAO|nr:DUF6787 family protein [Croceitalea sp. F388]MDT0607454.1 prolipoprotein diacylglyceryl transferase [Croceitalea sp. F388]